MVCADVRLCGVRRVDREYRHGSRRGVLSRSVALGGVVRCLHAAVHRWSYLSLVDRQCSR